MEERWDEGAFCQAYLRTMNPERAAAEAGRQNGFAILGADAAGQLRREDALRQLARLAFGQANDAVRLALRMDAADLKELDLSAVAEFKVTDKGGVEVKLVDRVRALETLCGLLECEGGRGTEALYQALTEGSGETEEAWDHG